MTAWTRKSLAATVAVALSLGLASAAGAQGQGQAPPGRGKVRIVMEFRDLGDAAWALKFIEKMKLRTVVRGFEDGTFRPHAALSQAQAVAMAARLLGLEEEARALTETALTFPGAASTPEWAHGYVALALEKRWVDPAHFHPQREASRLWTAVMLVKAMGLEAEAQAAGQPLTFTDSDAIPADMVGYVAVAVRENLITGFEDGSFRPNGPVTRAQMAALLDRVDEQGAAPRAADDLEGTLVSVGADGRSVTVQVAGEEKTITLAPDASVYVDGQPADLTSVTAGAEIELKLDASGQAVFVAVEVEDEDERSKVRGIVVRVEPAAPAPATESGGQTVSQATYGGNGQAGTITILVSAGRLRGTERTYGVAADAEITKSGEQIELADIQVGARVALKVEGDVAEEIRVQSDKVRKPGEKENGAIEAEGLVVSLAEPADGKPGRIVVQTGIHVQEFELGAEVEVEGRAGSLADIKAGDRVHLKGHEGVVTEIKVQQVAGGRGRDRDR